MLCEIVEGKFAELAGRRRELVFRSGCNADIDHRVRRQAENFQVLAVCGFRVESVAHGNAKAGFNHG